jgi:fructoselysine-6-P-deglycase FrlB-like protein
MTLSSSPAPWSPDAQGFVRDVERKPAQLERLGASRNVRGLVRGIAPPSDGVLLLGMGSSGYAAEDSARRLRAGGLWAVAELASVQQLPPPTPGLLVIAISASGRSAETLAAVGRYVGQARTVALTEDEGSPLAETCDIVVPLLAGHEEGGVACRSFTHSGLVLRLLEARLLGTALDFPRLCAAVASATADLLERRPEWLEPVSDLLDGPAGVHVIAPAERWSCAAQSALMFREGPRRPATASETAEWTHVDVYLTKTTDYRALLLTGSAADDEAMGWLTRRAATVVALGRPRTDVAASVGYLGADVPAVAAHTETIVAELVAARWWARTAAADKVTEQFAPTDPLSNDSREEGA